MKSWLRSRTIWGVIITAAAPLAARCLGVTITEADSKAILELWEILVTTAGAAFAIYGRVMATKTIG